MGAEQAHCWQRRVGGVAASAVPDGPALWLCAACLGDQDTLQPLDRTICHRSGRPPAGRAAQRRARRSSGGFCWFRRVQSSAGWVNCTGVCGLAAPLGAGLPASDTKKKKMGSEESWQELCDACARQCWTWLLAYLQERCLLLAAEEAARRAHRLRI